MTIQAEELLQAFHFRYACKHFNPNKKISDKDFQTILETGRLSPSSFGFEPWQFLVIQDKELKNDLAPIAWGAKNSLKGASLFVILLARKKADTIYSSNYISHIMTDIQHLSDEQATGKRQSFEHFQKSDFKLLDSDQTIFDWASKQTYIALANMLTVAACLEIDSCPIEGFDQEKVETLLANKGIINPQEFGVSVMAGFGYRDEEATPKTRQSKEDVVRYI